MPKRTEKEVKTSEQVVGKYKEAVDLSFLPEDYIRRIDEIFDSYFNLGMKLRRGEMDADTPIFPSKVSSLSSPELGDELSKFTAWYSYASDKQKYVAVADNYLQQQMNKVMDKALGEMVTGGGNIKAKEAKARSSEEYMLLMSYKHKLSGLKILLDSELSNYDKCISSLSREVARREHHGGF